MLFSRSGSCCVLVNILLTSAEAHRKLRVMPVNRSKADILFDLGAKKT